VLQETVPKGIAYHHSGLTDEERNIVEQGYRDGHLLLIAATSTLSTGINLPAKAVIFNAPLIGNSLMNKTHYKQMSGRAGRTGFDTFGESIMICEKNNLIYKNHIENTLMKADFSENQLESTIDQYTLRRLVLEVIASTAVKSFREIGTFMSKLLKVELLERSK
jgi:DNA polymerase theta